MNAAEPQPSLALRASEVCVIAKYTSHVLPRLNSPVVVVCACRIWLLRSLLGASVDYVDGALNQAQVGVTPVGFGWMIKW